VRPRHRYTLLQPGVICFIEKKTQQILKNNNLRKEIVDIQQTTNFRAQLSTSYCTTLWRSSFHMCVSIKSSIDLSSHIRIVAFKRKLLLVKHIHTKQQFTKMDVLKKNLIIRFAWEINGMDPPMYVVTK
jgi:hypothetical protein